MATKETVDLGPVHPPKEESIKAFKDIEPELKKQLIHLRHQHDKHEPEYFASAAHISDADLTAFSASDFDQVRVALSAYGVILFGRLRVPALGGAGYVQFRALSLGPDEPATFHSFHTEEKDDGKGGRSYRAIFAEDDELDWFDS